ncbi:MAG TPA: endo alpha-1,4 polygalactosaminidase [Polyangiaceae bacterium]
MAEAGALWQPTSAAPIHFHWMIGGFTTADVLSGQTGQVVYDIDGDGATAADVAAIHAAGAIAVCYVDVGTLEQGRPDYAQFPASVVGAGVQGWPGENWLLVTAANQSIILPLMKARFESWCQAKGFDAIEPDNLDAWTNITTVTETDNVAYDLAIGQMAHALPLSIGLKNVMTDLDASQYASFLGTFDWALNEQCFEYSECGAYTAAGSFLPAGKAVFDVEYNVSPDCATAATDHMNAQKTDLDLVGATSSGYSYAPCVPDSQTTW